MRAVCWVLPTEIDYGLGWVAVITLRLNYKKQDKFHWNPGPLWSKMHNTACLPSCLPHIPKQIQSVRQYEKSSSQINIAYSLLEVHNMKSTGRITTNNYIIFFNPHGTKHCSFGTVIYCCMRGRAPSQACMCTYHLKQLRTYTFQFPSHWSVNLINSNH